MSGSFAKIYGPQPAHIPGQEQHFDDRHTSAEPDRSLGAGAQKGQARNSRRFQRPVDRSYTSREAKREAVVRLSALRGSWGYERELPDVDEHPSPDRQSRPRKWDQKNQCWRYSHARDADPQRDAGSDGGAAA